MRKKQKEAPVYPRGSGGFMRPDEVLEGLEIKEGMRIADFGCGAGYLTIPLAKRVGKAGVIYAVDVLESALGAARGRAKMESLLNIEFIRANLEKEKGSGIHGETMDMVVLANILFQSKEKNAILKEAGRVLKKNGRIVVIEWNDGIHFGPPLAYKVPKETLKSIVKDAGFVLEKEFNAGESHYGLVFSL